MKGDAPILLARGRRAEIVRVTDEHDRTRILKLVRGGRDRERVERAMTAEFELHRRLRARGLVGCLGLESDGETWALHFEDVGGLSLDLRPGRLTAEEVRQVATSLARTLADLHAEGVLHLAVDPSHVLVLPGSSARLIGFGQAMPYPRAIVWPERARTDTTFLAPELTGRIALPVDARTDLYALGASITWMIARASGPTDPALAAIAAHLVAPHPDDRPASAQAVLGLLADDDVAPRGARVASSPELGGVRLVLDEAPRALFAAEVAAVALTAATDAPALHVGDLARRRADLGLGDPDGAIARLGRAVDEPLLLALDGLDRFDDRLVRAIVRRVRAPFAAPLTVWIAASEADPAQLEVIRAAIAARGAVETRAPASEARPHVVARATDADVTALVLALYVADADVDRAHLAGPLDGEIADVVMRATRDGLVLPILDTTRVRLDDAGRALAASLGAGAHGAAAIALGEALEPDEQRAHRLARVASFSASAVATAGQKLHVAMLLVDAIETTALGEAHTASAALGVTLLSMLDGDQRRDAKTSVRRALAEAARAAIEARDDRPRETLLGALLAMAAEPLDVAEVHALRAIAAFRRDDEVTALVEARAASKVLGVEMPVSASHARAAVETTAIAPTLLASGGELYTALRTTDGRKNVLVHDLLHAALAHARRLPPALATLLATTTLRESLARGASPATVLALSHLAVVTLDRARPLARAAARAAFTLSRRFRDTHARARAVIALTLTEAELDIEARAERARRARDEAVLAGLVDAAVDAIIAIVRVRARAGESLHALEAELREGARALGTQDPSIAALLQTVENLLADDTRLPWIHRGPTFEEGSIVEALEHGDRTTAARAIAAQLVLAGLFERVETVERLRAALALLGEDERAARDVPGFALQTALTASTMDAPLLPRTGKLLAVLGEAALDVRRRGAARLAVAEWLERLGADELALGLHEALAREGPSRAPAMERAVFAERLARAYGRRGDVAQSEAALREAHALYRRAGVNAKARALEAQHPWLAKGE